MTGSGSSSSSSSARISHHTDYGEAEIDAQKVEEDVTPGSNERQQNST